MEGKADTHCHTKHSGLTKLGFLRFPDSVSEPADVIKAAEKEKLNVLCVTDHNSVRGGMEAKKLATSVEIVVGEEINTSGGEVIGLFLTEGIRRDMSPEETIDVIHSQGGLAIAPHPFSAYCESLNFRIFELKLDGVEVLNAAQRDGYANSTALRLVENKPNIARIGASDAHTPAMIGNAYTLFEGTTAEELRKAILQKKTGWSGQVTPLREFVWMTAVTVAEMECILARSLFGRPMKSDSEVEAVVSKIRTISKVVSLVGATAFMFPPFLYLTAVAGDRVHSSRAKLSASKFLSRTEE